MGSISFGGCGVQSGCWCFALLPPKLEVGFGATLFCHHNSEVRFCAKQFCRQNSEVGFGAKYCLRFAYALLTVCLPLCFTVLTLAYALLTLCLPPFLLCLRFAYALLTLCLPLILSKGSYFTTKSTTFTRVCDSGCVFDIVCCALTFGGFLLLLDI